LRLKKGDDIAMAFENIDDLEPVIHIPEENYVVPIRNGSNAWQQFRAFTPDSARQTCEFVTVISSLANELPTDGNTVARFGDVNEDRPQIPFDRPEEERPPHSPMPRRRNSSLC